MTRILIREEADAAQTVVLRERDGAREFPIYIGLPEALAIHRGVRKEAGPRPFTHDLLADVVTRLGATLERVVIDRFVWEKQSGTFHAKLHLRRDGVEAIVDARPSDAIALVVRLGAPVFVEEGVLEAVVRPPEGPPGPGTGLEGDAGDPEDVEDGPEDDDVEPGDAAGQEGDTPHDG